MTAYRPSKVTAFEVRFLTVIQYVHCVVLLSVGQTPGGLRTLAFVLLARAGPYGNSLLISSAMMVRSENLK